MREYKECYIAVLDLLGFKAALKKYDCNTIATIFDEINEEYTISYNETREPIVNKEDIHIKVMSDSVCIYIESRTENALPALIATCDYFQIRMLRLKEPMLSRGAIVKGKLYHNNDVLFGEGFVKAYYMQENEAIYPRVIIEKNIIEGFKTNNNADQRYIDLLLTKDFDGYYFSDYLSLFYCLNHEQESWKNFIKYVIAKKENEENGRARAKYSYITESLPRIKKRFFQYIEENNNV
ncbi:MAG: hypothetical protein IKJ59_13245 [Clostridia bacterium]|nr:hypothetical protein [Clostridia bacterium]